MSRRDACLKVTSSPPRRMRPEVGSSRPAIIRRVVFWPHPDGPSRQKKSPLRMVKVESRTAAKSPNALCSLSTRISAMASFRKSGDDGEERRPRKGGDERVRVERHRERLQEHEDARRDDDDGGRFHPAAPQDPWPARGHFLTAPKVIPRNRFLRKSTVNPRMGTRKSVVAAATAGQSWPPSPMMKGMKGGVVCACPDVRSTAKAYSFQAKMRQKMAVATNPGVACGRRNLRKACRRVYAATDG